MLRSYKRAPITSVGPVPACTGRGCSLRYLLAGPLPRHAIVSAMNLICRECGAPFTKPGNRPRKFCTDPCARKAQRKRVGKTYRGRWYRHIRGAYAHRLIAAASLGRPLTPTEIVAFEDGDRTNLAPSNLLVFPDRAAFTAWRNRKDPH